MKPLAILSHILPPSPSGQALILYRLLQTLERDRYCLLSPHDYDAVSPDEGATPRLPARYHTLRPGSGLALAQRRVVRANRALKGLLQVVDLARSIAGVLRREQCGALVACSGGLADLPAGYLACRWARVPFLAYVFDYYSEQWVRPVDRLVARLAEPLLLKGARGILVPNELLRDAYRNRYGVAPVIVRNACDTGDVGEERAPWPAREGQVRIVYTGAVYHAHYDAFRNLVAALRQIDDANVALHLYTAQDPAELRREGIDGPVVFHPHQPRAQIVAVQRRADILFLPLAFQSPFPEVIKTSAPAKMGEYLASGRPILAHAPEGSFVSWYLREHACGLVVDRGDPAPLAAAIRHLRADEALRHTLCARARDRVRVDFSIDAARAAFLKAVAAAAAR